METRARYRPHVRVFVAGATGVIGIRLVPLLVAAGHEVAGMTRSPEKAEPLRALGAEPIVCNVYDAEELSAVVVSFAPDAVVDQLTDLPDDPARISDLRDAGSRMRREGTRNLVAAARKAGAGRFLAQSVAWPLRGDAGDSIEDLERAVLDAGGVVVRYGRFYGPGTYYEAEPPPPPPRVHVDEAARRTVPLLDAAGGIVLVTEDG
jgi:uncharacterized protein YbjT (DUF2867 family)